MRFRSKKREAIYRKRRPLVEQLLAERPICERCGTNPSTEIHEVVTRARGGSILDRANCRALCRGCHRWITEHPKQAHEVAAARAYLTAEGSIEARKAQAVIACADLALESELAQAKHRACRERIRTIGTQLDTGRTLSAAIRNQFMAEPIGQHT